MSSECCAHVGEGHRIRMRMLWVAVPDVSSSSLGWTTWFGATRLVLVPGHRIWMRRFWSPLSDVSVADPEDVNALGAANPLASKQIMAASNPEYGRCVGSNGCALPE